MDKTTANNLQNLMEDVMSKVNEAQDIWITNTIREIFGDGVLHDMIHGTWSELDKLELKSRKLDDATIETYLEFDGEQIGEVFEDATDLVEAEFEVEEKDESK